MVMAVHQDAHLSSLYKLQQGRCVVEIIVPWPGYWFWGKQLEGDVALGVGDITGGIGNIYSVLLA